MDGWIINYARSYEIPTHNVCTRLKTLTHNNMKLKATILFNVWSSILNSVEHAAFLPKPPPTHAMTQATFLPVHGTGIVSRSVHPIYHWTNVPAQRTRTRRGWYFSILSLVPAHQPTKKITHHWRAGANVQPWCIVTCLVTTCIQASGTSCMEFIQSAIRQLFPVNTCRYGSSPLLPV